MARRSAVRHGHKAAAYSGAARASTGVETRDYPDVRDYPDARDPAADTWADPYAGGDARRGGRRHWRGSGGRWRVWIGRFLLWACIIVLLVNGVRAEFDRFTAKPSQPQSAPRQDAKAQFPVTAAAAYAV